MRLVRRSVLCLVVGVTAFGIAGWLLRPKANWRTSLEAGEYALLIEPHALPDPGAPRWVYLRVNRSESIVVSFDPETGDRLNDVRVGGDYHINLPSATVDG